MPEYRGGSGSPIVLILVLLAVLIVGGVVIFLLLGGNSASQDTVQPTPVPAPVIRTDPAIVPQPQPTPMPVEPAPQQGSSMPEPFQPPQVLFGEVLAQGFVDLQLQTGQVRTFYTFQVDTSTQNIILFFALYDPTGQAISRSIVVEDYSQSVLINNAELTVYYPDAPATVIRFDKEAGTVESSQFYTTQPHGPGLFSSQMRIALIKQNLPLSSGDGNIGADMQLDPTGVADLSGYRVTINDAVTTETGLTEVQAIIDQLESRRPRS
jgi:hypothetical protein